MQNAETPFLYDLVSTGYLQAMYQQAVDYLIFLSRKCVFHRAFLLHRAILKGTDTTQCSYKVNMGAVADRKHSPPLV